MKKTSVVGGLIIGLGLLLTGCGNSFDYMPNLTEEESMLIAEYAAGILIKHDKNAGKLASDAEIAAADEREATRRANVEELEALLNQAENEEEASSKEEADETENGGDVPEPVTAAFEGIAQFCGLEGFHITYTGHMVCDFYPPENSEEPVFAMDATPGSKLLVLQFTAENVTTQDLELNMMDQGVKFRISINDGGMDNILPTLLLDDLSSYKGVIPAGTNIPLVLVREIPEEEAGTIQTISMSLRNVSGSATTLLG